MHAFAARRPSGRLDDADDAKLTLDHRRSKPRCTPKGLYTIAGLKPTSMKAAWRHLRLVGKGQALLSAEYLLP